MITKSIFFLFCPNGSKTRYMYEKGDFGEGCNDKKKTWNWWNIFIIAIYIPNTKIKYIVISLYSQSIIKECFTSDNI